MGSPPGATMVMKGKLTHTSHARLATVLALLALALACGSCSQSAGGWPISVYSGGTTSDPVAQISYSVSDTAGSLEVQFSAATSYDTDGSIVQYDWDFNNDGVYDEEDGGATTSYTYSAAGSYQTTVRVTDDDGLTDTATTASFTVPATNAAPTADFSYSLDATNRLLVNFDAGDSTDSDGTIQTYEWDWDNDGTYDATVTTAETTHTYAEYDTYTVGLRVTDDDGETGTATEQVEVTETGGNTAPTAVITITPNPPVIGQTFTLDASDSTDDDGTIVSYKFNLGDESEEDFEQDNGDDPIFESSFNITAGEYKFGVLVEDDQGATAKAYIEVTPVEDQLTAVIDADPVSGGAPLDVTFDASGSSPGDGEITDYEWDFDGDGEFNETGTDEETYHGDSGPFTVTYDTEGTYTAVLRITDDESATAVDDVEIEVTVATYTVTVGLTFTGMSGYDGTSDTNVKIYHGVPDAGGVPFDFLSFDSADMTDGTQTTMAFEGVEAADDLYLKLSNVVIEWDDGEGGTVQNDLYYGPFSVPPDHLAEFTGEQYKEKPDPQGS